MSPVIIPSHVAFDRPFTFSPVNSGVVLFLSPLSLSLSLNRNFENEGGEERRILYPVISISMRNLTSPRISRDPAYAERIRN